MIDETYRAPSPVEAFRANSDNPLIGADMSFIIATIAVIDGGGRIDSEKVADMRALIDAYLAATGQESLGWLRGDMTKGER